MGAFIGFVVALILMGPSDFLGLPDELYTVIGAFPLLGFCQVFVFLPIIPEMIERIQFSLKIKEGVNPSLDLRLSDVINESYVLIYAISAFVSPLIGGTLYMLYGMRKTFDIIAAVNIVYVVVLFTFNCGFNVYKENQVFEESRKTKGEYIKV